MERYTQIWNPLVLSVPYFKATAWTTIMDTQHSMTKMPKLIHTTPPLQSQIYATKIMSHFGDAVFILFN